MLTDLHASDLDLAVETLLREPFVAVTHAVRRKGHDPVLAGTRGLAAWEPFLVDCRGIVNCDVRGKATTTGHTLQGPNHPEEPGP